MILSLTSLCACSYYLGRHSVMFEDAMNKAMTDIQHAISKTPYGGTSEPESTKAIIIDPDDLNQQIEFTKREHDERLARLNPK